MRRDLKWNNHIAQITNKGKIIRNLKGCPTSIQVHAYKTIVRPILEYASIIWDPSYKTHVETLEKCQKRAMRHMTSTTYSHHIRTSELSKQLRLQNLETRRQINKLTTFHKIYINQSIIKLPDNIHKINRRTRRHDAKLSLPSSKTNNHHHSFFPSTVRMWNNLPAEVAEIESPDRFKALVEYCL